jgi:hypothetical protein
MWRCCVSPAASAVQASLHARKEFAGARCQAIAPPSAGAAGRATSARPARAGSRARRAAARPSLRAWGSASETTVERSRMRGRGAAAASPSSARISSTRRDSRCSTPSSPRWRGLPGWRAGARSRGPKLGAHPRPALRVTAPVSHRADLVKRERLARGAQDPQARHDRRIRRDAPTSSRSARRGRAGCPPRAVRAARRPAACAAARRAAHCHPHGRRPHRRSGHRGGAARRLRSRTRGPSPRCRHVELDLPAPVALEAFEHAFGEGHPAPRLHPGDAAEVLYYPAAPDGRQHTCAIIARVGADGVRAVAVRRDPRL